MSRYVTDTHALLWHLYTNPKLSPAAKSIFRLVNLGPGYAGPFLFGKVYFIPAGILAPPGSS